MNAEQRAAIRENAQYLRQVRPIDPAEIDEYVPDQPHPAAVRAVLRDSALELGLVERADGTFVPVSTDSIDATDLAVDGADAFDTGGVRAFPECHARRLEDRLIARYGPGWPDGESGDRLRERIRALKRAYFAGESVEYDADTALAYAIYHLPDYYAATSYLLSELASGELLPTDLRVLDIGAGVGGPALATVDTLPDEALCEYHAIEPSPAADLLKELLADAGRNNHAEIYRERAEEFEPGIEGSDECGQEDSGDSDNAEYDLLIFANVLSELDDPKGVVERYLDYLAPDGTLLLLAPADRETAIGLREVERAVADGDDNGAGTEIGAGAEAGVGDGSVTVYAPTARLWPGESPTDRCWSFDVKPDIETPGFQRRLDDAASDPNHKPGEFVNVDVQYAYSMLRTDGRRKIDITLDERRDAKLADSETRVSKRVDTTAIKLSHSLSDDGAGEASERGERNGRSERSRGGKNPLYLIGDGSQGVDHFAVLTRETVLNRALRKADYGSLLRFENVLVLWNDDEAAYNLVVDDETVVDSIPM
jgi:SAM-dependent methyltransferase